MITRSARRLIGAAVGGVMLSLTGSNALAQRTALPPECRATLRAQCATAQDRRSCLRRAIATLPDQCRKPMSVAAAAAPATLRAGTTEYAFGSDPAQKLDLSRPAGTRRAPLLLFVHGGGWSIGDKRRGAGNKAAHFTRLGFVFASTNYRLVPAATVEQQAGDIASAIAWARANAGRHGIDPDRIFLMGHSAGAHLAALVASDPAFLAAAGVPLAAVRKVVLLDGAGYDVRRQMASPANRVGPMYNAAFGSDPERQKRLSPLHHAAAPNAPQWLILAVAQRADSTAQSDQLASALERAGSSARVVRVEDSSHMKLNRSLGTAGDPATRAVDAFLTAP